MTENNMKIQATITCPECNSKQVERMPINACQYFYACPNCQKKIKPKPHDCCVFCSYADTKCPSKQNEGGDF